MKKLLLLFTFISHAINAQTYNVIEKQIEVTSHFYNSFILEMNTGNTVLLQMEPRIEGFLLKIYDNKHEERISKKVRIDNTKDINNLHIVSFIELNQRAELFYLLLQGDAVTFNKLEIEQYTGDYKNEILLSYKLPENMGYSYIDYNFFKVIENQKKSKYSIIVGSTEHNKEYKLNINTYNSVTNKQICKYAQVLNNSFQLELVDATMDDETVFLCLNKKEKPKDSETVGWWIVKEINYVPANKVSVMKLDINNRTTASTNLQLDDIIYSTKAQFTFDDKNDQVNLLLSCMNPDDKFWKVPDATTLFYKFQKSDLTIKLQKRITNQYAVSQAKARYPELNADRIGFANFPQYMFTDTDGNNTFLFETIYNQYNKPEGASDMIKQEFAVLYSTPEAEINAVRFSPYSYTTHGNSSGSFDEFTFSCNNYSKPSGPRYFGTEKEYYNFKTFEAGNQLIIISNILPKNCDKKLGDKFYPNRYNDIMNPMIHVISKDHYSYTKILGGDEYKKLRFNVNISSYNPNTKTFSVLATEMNGSKERLIWIKFD